MAWLVEISTPTPTGWMLVSQSKTERAARGIFTRMQATIDPGVGLRLIHNLETVETFRKPERLGEMRNELITLYMSYDRLINDARSYDRVRKLIEQRRAEETVIVERYGVYVNKAKQA